LSSDRGSPGPARPAGEPRNPGGLGRVSGRRKQPCREPRLLRVPHLPGRDCVHDTTESGSGDGAEAVEDPRFLPPGPPGESCGDLPGYSDHVPIGDTKRPYGASCDAPMAGEMRYRRQGLGGAISDGEPEEGVQCATLLKSLARGNMSLEVEYEAGAQCVVARLSGACEVSEIIGRYPEMIERCRLQGRKRLLVDFREVSMPLGMDDRYDPGHNATIFAQHGIKLATAATPIQLNRERFGAMVAKNRGVDVSTFEDFVEARERLLLSDA
jgi:hypothetical protein